MKVFSAALGLSGLAVFALGAYQLACGFLILAIVFALQWLTDHKS